MLIRKYNLRGEEIGQVSVEDRKFDDRINDQMVKDYLVAYRANQRQWSANTKGRAEVSHSKQKPHPQKGTGRARQGCLAAPQYKGGGIVFGPKPKFDQHVKVNKKEKKAIIRGLLAQKLRANLVSFVSMEGLEEPKTKVMASFLEQRSLQADRVLFIGEDIGQRFDSSFEHSVAEVISGEDQEVVDVPASVKEECESMMRTYARRDIVVRSLRNLPLVTFMVLSTINGYEIARHQEIVLVDEALDSFISMLQGE